MGNSALTCTRYRSTDFSEWRKRSSYDYLKQRKRARLMRRKFPVEARNEPTSSLCRLKRRSRNDRALQNLSRIAFMAIIRCSVVGSYPVLQRGFIRRNAEIIYVLQRCLLRQMRYFWRTCITYARTRCGRMARNVKIFMAFGGQLSRAVISG